MVNLEVVIRLDAEFVRGRDGSKRCRGFHAATRTLSNPPPYGAGQFTFVLCKGAAAVGSGALSVMRSTGWLKSLNPGSSNSSWAWRASYAGVCALQTQARTMVTR